MWAHLELRKNGTRAKKSHDLIAGSDRNRGKKLSGKNSTAAGCWFIAATMVRPWRDVSGIQAVGIK